MRYRLAAVAVETSQRASQMRHRLAVLEVEDDDADAFIHGHLGYEVADETVLDGVAGRGGGLVRGVRFHHHMAHQGLDVAVVAVAHQGLDVAVVAVSWALLMEITFGQVANMVYGFLE